MFVLVFVVPALLVVVLGYAVGYAVWAGLTAGTSLAPHAEVAGWLTGLLLLTGTVHVAVRAWRARRRHPR